jgi:hypothetical protein
MVGLKPGYGTILARWFVGRSKILRTPCWMLRKTSCAMPVDRSAARLGRIPVRSYERTLQTNAGEVNLKVPKLRRQTFEAAIIKRYRRREGSVEEALIERCCYSACNTP